MKKIPVILFFTLLCFELFSQNSKDTIIHIDEVKITDRKILKPDRVIAICTEQQKINPEIIRHNNTKSLAELLTENSSVFIKSYGQGSLATASIRGSGASHTQVLWNDIPLNNPMLGQTDFSQIPVFFIDKAEISEGGSSLFSGIGALGGCILLNSLPDTAEKFSSEIIQTFGSNKTFQTFFKIATGNSKINTVFKIYREQSENDFLFYNNATGNPEYERQKNADYKKNALLNTTSINFTESKNLNVNTWFQYDNRNIPPIMSFLGTGKIEYQKDLNFKTVAKYLFRKNKTENKITAAFTNENLDYFSGTKIETELLTYTNSESNTKRFSAKFSSNYDLNKKIFLKTELTAEYQKAEYFDKKTAISYQADRKIADYMLYADYKMNKNAFFSLKLLILRKKLNIILKNLFLILFISSFVAKSQDTLLINKDNSPFFIKKDLIIKDSN
ncbi:MAG: TonB-dependent receptor plug domain-containing protein, partial [Bacteroidales bacterium]|nr:TonB-dependent receptor plug domain-containing protein [Bacteroidales bacterium]